MGNSWSSNFWVDYFQTRNCGIVGIPVRRFENLGLRAKVFWKVECKCFVVRIWWIHGSWTIYLPKDRWLFQCSTALWYLSCVKAKKTRNRERIRDDFLFVFLDGWSVSYRNLMQISELKCFRWCMYWLGTRCHHTLASLHSTHWVRQVPSFEHSGHLNIHPPPSCKNSTQNPRMASNSNRKSSSSPISIHHFFFEGMMG